MESQGYLKSLEECLMESQGYLKSLEDKTVVIVSHDRAFLDEVTQEIIIFRNKKLTYHTGRLACQASANQIIKTI